MGKLIVARHEKIHKNESGGMKLLWNLAFALKEHGISGIDAYHCSQEEPSFLVTGFLKKQLSITRHETTNAPALNAPPEPAIGVEPLSDDAMRYLYDDILPKVDEGSSTITVVTSGVVMQSIMAQLGVDRGVFPDASVAEQGSRQARAYVYDAAI